MTLSLKGVSCACCFAMVKRKHRHELAVRKIVESLQYVSFMHKSTEFIIWKIFNNFVR